MQIGSNKAAKACTTCAKAKARCIPGPIDGHECQRCHRLRKECFSRPPAPPRIKKRLKRSKVAELETRLNELSSQFDQARTAPSHQDEHPVASPDVHSNGSSTRPAAAAASPPDLCEPTPPDSGILRLGHLFNPGLGSTPEAICVSLRRDAWTSLWPQQGEASVLLGEYHAVYADLYPFVVVPREMTPEFLVERPYLWKAVMVTTCFFDGPRHVKLAEELLADIGQAAVLNGVKTLDLLQGMQVLTAWYSFALKSMQLTNLLFLARSLCINLGSSGESSISQAVASGNLDQLRAYAGTYYMSTCVFTTNKRIEAFMDSSLLEPCCAALEEAKQYPSDEFLVQLVKIQQIAHSISLTVAQRPGQPTFQMPLTMVIQSFQEQLDAFHNTLPIHLKDHTTLRNHIAIAEVLLTEIATSDQHCASSMRLTDRLQLLWSCARSIRTFLDIRFRRLHIEEPASGCLSATDFAYTVLTGMKLLSLRLPGWDAAQVSGELALVPMIDRQVEEMVALTARRRGDVDGLPRTRTFSVEETRGRAGTAADPLDGLLRLLRNVREILKASLERQRPEAKAEAVPEIETEMQLEFDDEELYRELLNDAMWNLNDIPLEIDGS